MSYAKITEPVKVSDEAGNIFRVLPVGTLVKWIELRPRGVYAFQAYPPNESEWLSVVTVADLPAHTDKGAQQRAAGRPARLKRGKPSFGAELRPLGVKLSEMQRAWVEEMAKREDYKPSTWVKRVLEEMGMPKQ